MEIKIEFLTPAFLYGPSHQSAEFRIPSLLGQMRYWWRMTQDWGDIGKMREKEASVFGLGDQGAKPFYLYLKERIQLPLQSPVVVLDKHGKPATDRKTRKPLFKFPTRSMGIAYFFYPFMRHIDKFSWIPQRQKIRLEFEPCTTDKEIFEQLYLSLFLTGCFGGLGARSRRGGGSVKITVSDCSLFKLTEMDLFKHINGTAPLDAKVYPCFSHIHADSPLQKALENKNRFRTDIQCANNWEESLGASGATMQGFRTKNRMMTAPGKVDETFLNEARQLHSYYKNGISPPKILTKDAFGLPRQINFPPEMSALTVAPYKNGEEMRRSSPLHISVNRNTNGQYYCTFLILWEKINFLPSDMQIRLKKKNNGHTNLANPGPEKLEEFLRRFD